MDPRRKKPTDMAGIKRSRAAHTGTVTRIWDKLANIPFDQTEEVELIQLPEIQNHLNTLLKSETGYNFSIEEAQEFAPEEESDYSDFQQSEADAIETFETSLLRARMLGEKLSACKTVLTRMASFKTDLEALQSSLSDQPDLDYSSSFSKLDNLFSTMREQWTQAGLSKDHPLKQELDSCSK